MMKSLGAVQQPYHEGKKGGTLPCGGVRRFDMAKERYAVDAADLVGNERGIMEA
jgi:hypothetical protein